MAASLPPDVGTSLTCGPADAIEERYLFWAYESVRLTARFVDRATRLPIEVSGVSFAFLYPDGSQAIVPVDFAVRLGVGVWACGIAVAKDGTWQAVARCTSPTGSVDAVSFTVKALRAGTPIPPSTLVTDSTGTFLLLTPDGAMISA